MRAGKKTAPVKDEGRIPAMKKSLGDLSTIPRACPELVPAGGDAA